MDYLVIDNVLANERRRGGPRYSIPIVQAFPDKWKLIHVSGDSGARVYRREPVERSAPEG